MNSSSQKRSRVERIRSIEDSKLTAFAVQYAAAQSQLNQCHNIRTDLQSQIDSGTHLGNSGQVQDHQQSLVWLDHLQQRLRDVAERIKESEAACDKIRQQMIDQKVKVNGWEKLSQKLKSESDAELQADESLSADDRFLSKPTTR